MSAGALTRDERDLIEGLALAGVQRATATLAVVMYARRHVRPRPELLDLVASYPRLGDPAACADALDDAEARGWVVEIPSRYDGPSLLQAAPDLRDQLSALIPTLVPELERSLRTSAPVKVLGHMGEPEVYDTFSTRLAEAQTDIALPMVMTSDQLDAVEVLKAQADAGVQVRVLLATSDLAGEIRGRDKVSTAQARLNAWRQHGRSRRNLHVRVTRHHRDLRDASSMLVDGRFLRYDVYDDETERSTDGVMIEVSADRKTNIARMFQDRFDDAWSRARPLGFWGSVGWVVRRWWWVGVLAGLLVGFFLIKDKHPDLANLVLGAAVGYAVNHADPLAERLRQLWERVRS